MVSLKGNTDTNHHPLPPTWLEGEWLVLPGYDYSSGSGGLQLLSLGNPGVSQSGTHVKFPLDHYLPGKNETKKILIFGALLDVQ